MRFVCDSCRAQYMISDDKIGAKGVKIRCKKCGHTIVVRPAGAAAPKDDGSSEASASESTATTAANGAANSNAANPLGSLGTPPEGGLFTGVEEDEIGAVFDQVLNSGSQKIGSGDSDKAKESKSATPEAVRKLAEAEDQPDEPKAAAPANDWFVAIDEKQVGPLTVDKIKEHWDRGEVGPDSLCWRAGFSDWIPLSEAKELASVLAPRPAKPVIVAPAAVAAASSAPSAPVESAFSAGAASKNNRPEIPAAPALGQEPTSSGWKPSAASVLASLVKEENDALSKPPPKPAVEEKPAAPGLLDLPPPEPAMAPAARAAPMMAVAAEPMRAHQPAPMPYAPAPAPAPAYAQPAPAYGQPAYAGAGYPQPAYPGYPPSAAPVPQGGGNKTVMFAAIGGVVVLLLAVGGFFAFRSPPPQPSEPVAAVTPAPQPKAPEPAPPPVAKVEPQPSAPAPAAPTPAPAVAATPTPAPAAGTATPPAAAATPTPPPTTPAPPPASEAVAKVTPGTREPSSRTGERKPSSETSRPSSSGSPKSESVAKPSSKQSDDGLGDDFDDLFGTKKPSSGSKSASGEKTPSTYIPPAPGSGASDVPERLGQSDIMAVVVANKPAIVKCVNEQKKKDPGLTGRLVMRWVIQTSGKTTGVSVKSEEFKKTYMASCISGLIKGWNFPRHKKQGDPIDFPFIF
jgi:predicted Zn finger-like uncharacterized protein